MQIIRNRKVFDVCVVGSGAGGGMAAKVLTEAGADVVMLEAGVPWDSARDAKMFAWSYDAPHRGAAVPSRQFGELDAGLGGWTLDGEPYTTGPDSRFDWVDLECLRRFDKTLVACADAEKIVVLDDISKPPPELAAPGAGTSDVAPTRPEANESPVVPVLSHGRAFFSSFRDLTATGFWTTKMGMADLHYMGNRVVATWEGCPADALKKLGVSYDR